MQAPLLAAYRRTRYCVDAPNGSRFELRIGQRCPALDELLQGRGAHGAAFITAWNPRSVALPAAENQARQQHLREDIVSRDLSTLPGQGLPPDPSWEPEDSLLVLDLDVPEALALALAHEQYAIVYHRRGQASELLLTPLGEAA